MEKAEIKERFGPNHMLVDRCIISSPGGETISQIEPIIDVILPPVPEFEPVEEAHLYLSPTHLAGQGNHSVLYNAEWEIWLLC